MKNPDAVELGINRDDEEVNDFSSLHTLTDEDTSVKMKSDLEASPDDIKEHARLPGKDVGHGKEAQVKSPALAEEQVAVTNVESSLAPSSPGGVMMRQAARNVRRKGTAVYRMKASNPTNKPSASKVLSSPAKLGSEAIAPSLAATAVAAANIASLSVFPKDLSRDYVSIHDDVYNLFFLSNVGGHAFFYSVYVFVLKILFYAFLMVDVVRRITPLGSLEADELVLASQFLILPVMVAFQDDLTATFYLIANIKYCDSVRNKNPDAFAWKFYVATLCRAVDGIFSLVVNFVVLVSATDVLGMFLNFAALQFLQHVDNMALDLAADGFLTERLEDVARNVKEAELPKRSNDNWLRSMDTVLYVSTVMVLCVLWAIFSFAL